MFKYVSCAVGCSVVKLLWDSLPSLLPQDGQLKTQIWHATRQSQTVSHFSPALQHTRPCRYPCLCFLCWYLSESASPCPSYATTEWQELNAIGRDIFRILLLKLWMSALDFGLFASYDSHAHSHATFCPRCWLGRVRVDQCVVRSRLTSNNQVGASFVGS